MSRLGKFFPMVEMPRPAGSFNKFTIAALQKAREFGDEFTVKQFCDWLVQAGDTNKSATSPASIGIRLSKLTAPEGGRPDALHPLIRTQAGRRGPGGTGMFRYVFDGPPGRDPNAAVAPKKKQADEIPFEDEMDDDETGDEEGAEDEEEPEAPAPAPRAQLRPGLLPKPDPDGEWIQQNMADLDKIGLGETDAADMWAEISKANDSTQVDQIMRTHQVPVTARTKAIRVAKYIFDKMGRDWDTGGVAAARPANPSAGDRKYGKPNDDQRVKMPQKKAEPEEPAPQASSELPDDFNIDDLDLDDILGGGDEGEFSPAPEEEPPAQPEPEPSTQAQAGAANFVKPSQPAPAKKPSGANVKNIANLMKRFGGKR